MKILLKQISKRIPLEISFFSLLGKFPRFLKAKLCGRIIKETHGELLEGFHINISYRTLGEIAGEIWISKGSPGEISFINGVISEGYCWRVVKNFLKKLLEKFLEGLMIFWKNTRTDFWKFWWNPWGIRGKLSRGSIRILS